MGTLKAIGIGIVAVAAFAAVVVRALHQHTSSRNFGRLTAVGFRRERLNTGSLHKGCSIT
jgi:hypothetical protein